MPARIVSIHYVLTDSSGQAIDSSVGGDPFSYLEGSGQIIPGLENAVTVLAVGDKKRIPVAAPDAYGVRDERLIVTVGRDQLPAPEVSVGDRFRGGQEAGARIFTVTAVDKEQVTLDGNHPLAGRDLVFDVEVVAMRPATDEEISHGHAHGPEGHSH